MFKKLALIAVLSFVTSSSFAEDIPTRFGALEINDENMLLYKKLPLNPEIQGNNGLSVLGTYQFGNSDVILIQDNGGVACPAQLYFVTVSASDVKATSDFGTCSDLMNIKQTTDSISITMPGFMGPFESEAAQSKAAKKKHVYVFKGGVLTENGKPDKKLSSNNTVAKKMMGDSIDKNPNAKPNGAAEVKEKKLKKPWQDENGFVHYPDGSISASPVD